MRLISMYFDSPPALIIIWSYLIIFDIKSKLYRITFESYISLAFMRKLFKSLNYEKESDN